MNKTVNINLGGLVFTIDENAFELLKNYLDSIKSYFTASEGRDEIMGDIEARIAEMFQEKLESDKSTVVSLAYVESVIKAMGKPEDIAGEEEPTSDDTSFVPPKTKGKKRFYRNPDDKILGGVSSGIAAYFDLDPIWIRLAFIFLTVFFGGTGLIFYIILWIIIPKAETLAEKLEMRGECVNLSNIERSMKEEMDNIKTQFSNMKEDIAKKQPRSRFGKFLKDFFGFIATVFEAFFKIAFKLLGVLFIIFGIVVLSILLFSLLVGLGVVTYQIPWVLPLFAQSQWLVLMAIIGLLLSIGVPFFSLVYKGLQWLLDFKTKSRALGVSAGILWVAGIIMLLLSFSLIGKNFADSNRVTESHSIYPTTDTTYLWKSNVSMESDKYRFFGKTLKMERKEDGYLSDNVELDIHRSNNSNMELEVVRYANADDEIEARNIAENIEYKWEKNDTSVMFDPVLFFTENDPWRNQRVRMVLKLPVGHTIFLSNSMRGIIYDIKNVTNMYDGYMVGHYWQMRQNGLTCLDCDDAPDGNYGPDLTKVYELPTFSKIDIGGAYTVRVTQGQNQKVSVSAPEEEMEKIDVEVEMEELTIYHDDDFWDINFFKKKKPVLVFIEIPTIEEVSLSGAVSSTIKGFDLDELDVELTGASSSRSEMDVKNLTVDLSGASEFRIEGKGNTLKADLTGASELNAENFEVDKAYIDMSGATEAEIWVKSFLNIDASGASELTYKGNPEIEKSVSRASEIKQK